MKNGGKSFCPGDGSILYNSGIRGVVEEGLRGRQQKRGFTTFNCHELFTTDRVKECFSPGLQGYCVNFAVGLQRKVPVNTNGWIFRMQESVEGKNRF